MGYTADPMDGRADLRLAGPLPTPEQGPGEERPVVGIVRQAGDDSVDGPPAAALPCGCRIPLLQCSLKWLMGQTLRGLTNLQDLSLAETAITDSGLAHISGLGSLRKLHLDDTRISDAGLVS